MHYLCDQMRNAECKYLSIFHFADNSFDNIDLITAIKQFIGNFEVEEKVILKYHLENSNAAKPDGIIQNGNTRLKFEYKKKMSVAESAVILKIPSLVPSYAELKQTNMFERELYFYLTLLPELYKLGQCEPFAPKLQAATEAMALVLEDLSFQGYKPGNQISQLDLDHCIISLDALAIYHALGYVFLQNPSQHTQDVVLLRAIQPTLIEEPRKDNFYVFCAVVKSHVSGPLHKSILKLQSEILADPMAKERPKDDSFTVIAHADFRKSKILFKYNGTGSVIQAKLIEWYLSREASPVLDLIHFLVTSIPIEIFQDNDDTLLNSYLEKLNNQLSSSKSGRLYNRLELDEDIDYYKYYFLRIIWQQSMRPGSPGPDTDTYLSSAMKWLKYLESKGLFQKETAQIQAL